MLLTQRVIVVIWKVLPERAVGADSPSQRGVNRRHTGSRKFTGRQSRDGGEWDKLDIFYTEPAQLGGLNGLLLCLLFSQSVSIVLPLSAVVRG